MEGDIERAKGFEGRERDAKVVEVRDFERLWMWSVESHEAETRSEVAGSYVMHLMGLECVDRVD